VLVEVFTAVGAVTGFYLVVATQPVYHCSGHVHSPHNNNNNNNKIALSNLAIGRTEFPISYNAAPYIGP